MKWRAVPGWEERYQVSDVGDVRSLDMRCGGAVRRGRVLKQTPKGGRYHAVTLTAPDRRAQVFVHDIVALAFIGPKPAGLHTCHRDDNKANNAASNLRYDTPLGNTFDRHMNDGIARGERHGGARLTASHVRAIRARAADAGKAMAAEFGITYPHLHAVITRRVWRHI